MKVIHEKVKLPLPYDPYEEDCCGAFSADTVTITENREEKWPDGNNIKIVIQEKRSGIGDDFEIVISGAGMTKKIIAYVDDDGEFVCEMKGNDL